MIINQTLAATPRRCIETLSCAWFAEAATLRDCRVINGSARNKGLTWCVRGDLVPALRNSEDRRGVRDESDCDTRRSKWEKL